MSVKKVAIFILFSGSFSAMAQHTKPASDTVLKGSTIEVIQAYKPKVKQSPKPEWIPQLPPVDTSHPQFNYDVPQQPLYYTYNSLPLQPLALGREQARHPFPNYVKAGGGNLSTIFFDAGIGGLYGENFESGIHLHHLSQKGNVKNQQSSLSGIEAEGILHTTKTDWHAGITALRNQYGYYGYNHSFHDYPTDSIRQTYTTLRADIDFKNRLDSNSRFSYNPGLTASLYNARFNTFETNIGFNVPFVYKLDNALDMQLAVRGALTHFQNDVQSEGNNYIAAIPGLALHTRHLSGHALLGLALGKESQGHILPDVAGEFRATDNKFIIGGGWKADLIRNTYEQLTTENPYMASAYSIVQGRRDEVYGKFHGRAGDHFTFSGKVSWWNFKNLATFLNDYTIPNDQKLFTISYQDVKAISFQAGARYVVADKWSVGATGEFYSFYNIADADGFSDQYVWHTPAMKLKGDFTIVPVRKLTCTAYLSLLGGIHAKDAVGNVVNLSTIVDLGGNAEYQLVSRLSIFAELHNLLNYKYQRWYGYDVYGLNIYGGLRLKF